MARGYPDYNNPVYSIAVKNIDLSSMLIGLVGIVPCDGRGRLFLADNFGEGQFAWFNSTGGNGAAYGCSTETPEIAPSSMVLFGGTLAGLGFCRAQKPLRLSGSSHFGLEIGSRDRFANSYVIVGVEYQIGAIAYKAHLRFEASTGKVWLDTPTGYQLVTTLPATTPTSSYYPIKVVADFSTGKYTRVIIGNLELDVSGYSLVVGGGLGHEEAVVLIQAEGRGGTSSEVHVGHVFVTLDEP